MRLRWLTDANRSLESQLSYLADRNPLAADGILGDIQSAVDRLMDFPHSGRQGRLNGTRELPVTGTPYLVIYRLKRSVIEIVRVVHGAQRWPPRKKAEH